MDLISLGERTLRRMITAIALMALSGQPAHAQTNGQTFNLGKPSGTDTAGTRIVKPRSFYGLTGDDPGGWPSYWLVTFATCGDVMRLNDEGFAATSETSDAVSSAFSKTTDGQAWYALGAFLNGASAGSGNRDPWNIVRTACQAFPSENFSNVVKVALKAQ